LKKKSLIFLAASIITIAACDYLIVDLFSSRDYYLLPLSFTLIALYVSSLTLVRMGSISMPFHRKAWNLTLLLTFVVCGATGLLIAVRLDLKWDVPYMALLSFWHNETGITMTLIAAFHAFAHWRYYAGMLGPKEKD
jgi:hypothetical protein